MPPRIFISYRRDDAAGDAGRLADHLHRRFGKDRVFLDIDTIDPGTDFVRVLHDSLQETAAVLVVIGPRWTSVRSADGARRLESARDFVRLEVETALGRSIPVVPVLVQGAKMPDAKDLPSSLASLVNRQAATLDHAEFHDDAERLCDRLAAMIGGQTPSRWSAMLRWWPQAMRRWWPAAAVAVVVLGLAAYFVAGRMNRGPVEDPAIRERTRNAEALVATADAQRRRNQYADALATLTRASEMAPSLTSIRIAREDTAMEWIREIRVEGEAEKFGTAIAPALAVVDEALPSASGARKADLLAHTGWATFLLWRDGDRRLDPAASYREALSIDSGNPFANAMLAHWTLFQDRNAVAEAAALFDTAVRAGRALDAVRTLQWAAYSNSNSPAAEVERIRLANTIRKAGGRLNIRQAQSMWAPYYYAMGSDRAQYRDTLLDAVPPDEYLSTLAWAFEEYNAKDEARLQTIRLYVALLHAKQGRVDQAADELRALDKVLGDSGSEGVLRSAVQESIEHLSPSPAPTPARRRRAPTR
jgi:TIR domain-containing protein